MVSKHECKIYIPFCHGNLNPVSQFAQFHHHLKGDKTPVQCGKGIYTADPVLGAAGNSIKLKKTLSWTLKKPLSESTLSMLEICIQKAAACKTVCNIKRGLFVPQYLCLLEYKLLCSVNNV